MKFRGTTARWKGNTFELHFSTYLDGKQMNAPYYLYINPAGTGGGPWISTERTHRFTSPEDAQLFCDSIQAGKITLPQLRDEQVTAEAVHRKAQDAADRTQAYELLAKLNELNVSYDTAQKAAHILFSASEPVRSLCAELSSQASDPAKLIQENIVNISMKAYDLILKPKVDLDSRGGFLGLSDFILTAAKEYERQVGANLNHDAPDEPDYWESIDNFAEQALREEYGEELELSDARSMSDAPAQIKVILDNGVIDTILKDCERPIHVEVVDCNDDYEDIDQLREYRDQLVSDTKFRECAYSSANFEDFEAERSTPHNALDDMLRTAQTRSGEPRSDKQLEEERM